MPNFRGSIPLGDNTTEMNCKQNEVFIYRGLRSSLYLLQEVLMEKLIFFAAAEAY